MTLPAQLYVTGTDTSAGKTRFSVALVYAWREAGYRVAAMKPIASGCEQTPEGLRNDDALALQAASNLTLPYEDVNPEALLEPVSPHIAANWRGQRVDLDRIHQACQRLKASSQRLVVEGVGGWAAPLGDQLDQANLCRRLDLPVLLVVGLRLGCLNHAALTLRAIESDGIPWAGWGVSVLDPEMAAQEENLDWLKRIMPGPFVGLLGYGCEMLRIE